MLNDHSNKSQEKDTGNAIMIENLRLDYLNQLAKKDKEIILVKRDKEDIETKYRQ